MKKLSMALVIAMLVSMFTPSVMAATVTFEDFTSATIADNGIPTGWGRISGGAPTGSIEDGVLGLTAGDKVAKITSTTKPGELRHGYYISPDTVQISQNSKIHMTTTIAAADSKFSVIGLGFKEGNLSYIESEGGTATSTSTLASFRALEGENNIAPQFLAFVNTSDGVKLMAMGHDVTPDGFNFKLNKFYKLDCIVNGFSNTMDVYLDNVKLTEAPVDYSNRYAAVWHSSKENDMSANYEQHFTSFKYPLVVQYSSTGSTLYIDNTGLTVYGADETLPALTVPETTVSISGYNYDNDTINIVSTGNVAAKTFLTKNASVSGENSTLSIVSADGTTKAADSDTAIATGDVLAEVIDINGDGTNKIVKYHQTFNFVKVANATSWNFDNWDESYIVGLENSNMPVGWGNINGGRNSKLMSGKFGKAANDKFVAITTTNNTRWAAPAVYAATHQLVNNTDMKYFSANIAADSTNFYQLGLVSSRADVKYTDANGTEQSVGEADFAGSIALMAFEKDADGNVIITSWGQDITPDDFVFEVNKFYKFDCVIKGNTMDAYLDGKLIETVDFSSNFNGMTKGSTTYDFTQYSSYYVSQFRRIGIVQHKPNTYTGAFTAYFDDISVSTNSEVSISEPANTISVKAFKKDGNAIYLGSHTDLTVAEIKKYVTSTNTLVFVDANGNTKAESDLIANGDRVIEASNGVYTYYTFVVSTPGAVQAKIMYSDYLPETDKTYPEGHNFWSTTDYYLYAQKGAFGKSADDNALKISNSGNGANLIYSATEPLLTNNIHVSGEFAIDTVSFTEVGLFHTFKTDKTDRKSLGIPLCFAKDTDGNVIVSMFGTDVTPENFEFEMKRFYKMDLYYMTNGYVDGYLNGEYLGTVNYRALTDETISKIKYFFVASHYTSRNGHVYIDNLYIDSYAGGYPSIAYDRASEKIINDAGLKANGVIYKNYGVTASDIMANVTSANTVKFFDKDFEAEITEGVLSNGTVMVEYAKDGETMHYNTILMPYGALEFEKEAVTVDDAEKIRYKAKVVFADSGVKSNYKVLLAAYNGGKLESIADTDVTLTESYGREYTVTATLDFNEVDSGRTFKALLWNDDMAPMFVPVTTPVEIVE